MPETKYGKYIITKHVKQLKSSHEKGIRPEDQTEVLLLDDEVLKGAFFVNGVWFWPEMVNNPVETIEPHSHDYDEVLACFGTDTQNPHDLGGELVACIGDEKHVITESCIIFLPKGTKHGPFRFTRMDRPIFHFSISLAKQYK